MPEPPKCPDLSEPLPPELGSQTAFLDRIHAYLPGREMRKLLPYTSAVGFGFMTDYLGAIFERLRNRNSQNIVEQHVRMDGLKSRDLDAVEKTTAALLKLVYPHRTVDTIQREEIAPCVDLAVRCRQRVLTELGTIAPSEFRGSIIEVATV